MATRRSQQSPLREENLKVLWHKDGTAYLDPEETRSWSVHRRLQGLELLRRIVYGYNPKTVRIDRSVFEIVKTEFRN